MREVGRDKQFEDTTEFLPVLSNTQPSETELVTVALLMRIYDIQMALLSKVDKELADSIYDTHNNGGHFNPQIFIPSATGEV